MTNFPTSLDTLTNPTSTDPVTSPDHAAQHANANDSIEALEAKVGVNSSGVTTSHDYKLGEVTGTDKAVGKTATQTLTNKTLTSPTINSPTITTPTIASFTNATHNHQDAAGGGQLSATSIFSGGTVPTARLGSGSASSTTFLRGDQTWATPVVTASSGSTTHDISSTTTKNIAHGLGTTPSYARVCLNFYHSGNSIISTSEGVLTGSGATYQSSRMEFQGDGTPDIGISTQLISYASSSDYNVGTLTADATNISIAWSKSGTPTGTINIIWQALK